MLMLITFLIIDLMNPAHLEPVLDYNRVTTANCCQHGLKIASARDRVLEITRVEIPAV
jgi:hypothetical protein